MSHAKSLVMNLGVAAQTNGIFLCRPGVADMQELPAIPALAAHTGGGSRAAAVVETIADKPSVWSSPTTWTDRSLTRLETLTPCCLTGWLALSIPAAAHLVLSVLVSLEQLTCQLLQRLPVCIALTRRLSWQ